MKLLNDIGRLVGTIILSIISSLAFTYVILSYYNWFALDFIKVQITYIQMFGLLLLYSAINAGLYYQININHAKLLIQLQKIYSNVETANTMDFITETIVKIIIVYPIMMFFGWMYHSLFF